MTPSGSHRGLVQPLYLDGSGGCGPVASGRAPQRERFYIPARVSGDAMYRPPRLIAVACIAVVLLTAATPAIWDSLVVVFEPVDHLFAAVVVVETVWPEDLSPSPFPVAEPLESRGPPLL